MTRHIPRAAQPNFLAVGNDAWLQLIACLQMQVYTGRHFGDGTFAEEELDEFTVLIHQIHDVGMVDGVVGRAIFKLNFLRVNLIGRFGRIDLFLRACQTRQTFGEAVCRNIELQAFGCVSFRINADENVIQLIPLGVYTRLGRAHFLQGGWANIGAIGKAEINKARLAQRIGLSDGLAVLVHERIGPANFRLARHNRLADFCCRVTARGQAQREEAICG